MSKKRRDIPAFGLPIIETHFHLDYLKDASVGDILQQARDIGVERFMTIAVAPENMETVIKLTEEHSDVVLLVKDLGLLAAVHSSATAVARALPSPRSALCRAVRKMYHGLLWGGKLRINPLNICPIELTTA